MDPTVVTIIAALASAPALTVLVTSIMARRSNQLSVDKAQLEMRLELHKEVQALRTELQATRDQNDELAELLDHERDLNKALEIERKQDKIMINHLQQQLVEASNNVATLTSEVSKLRNRIQALETAGILEERERGGT